MVELKNIGEFYMWRATFEDGRILDEFYEEDDKVKETEFSEVQKKEGLKKFELIGQGTEISFNDEGVFHIVDKDIKFLIEEEETKIDLLEGIKNNLIMFRTNYKDVETSNDFVAVYSFGYKIETEVAYVSLYFFNGVDGNGFKIKITGKRDTEIKLTLLSDGVALMPHKINIYKNRAITINI